MNPGSFAHRPGADWTITLDREDMRHLVSAAQRVEEKLRGQEGRTRLSGGGGRNINKLLCNDLGASGAYALREIFRGRRNEGACQKEGEGGKI